MLQVYISHFMEAFTGEKTKGPRRGLHVKLQKVWPSVKEELDKIEGLIKWNWRALQVGSPLFDIAKEAQEFGRRALLVKSLLEMTLGSFVSCLFSTWEETFQDLISPVPATKQGEHWNGSLCKF